MFFFCSGTNKVYQYFFLFKCRGHANYGVWLEGYLSVIREIGISAIFYL